MMNMPLPDGGETAPEPPTPEVANEITVGTSAGDGSALSPTLMEAGWRQAYSTTHGKTYYYNFGTRESKWDMPGLSDEQPMIQPQLSNDMLAAVMAQLSNTAPLNGPIAVPVQQPTPPPAVASGSGVSGTSSKSTAGVKRRFAPDPDQSENEKNAARFQIGGERYAVVKRFKGRPYVNIREYYTNDNSTKLLAGKKGINLTPEQWRKLGMQSSKITEAVNNMY